jgi:hypothetical protein
MFGGFPRRYKSGSFAPFRVDNRQQNPMYHTRRNHPLLAMSIVDSEAVNGKSVIEHELRVSESDAVLA